LVGEGAALSFSLSRCLSCVLALFACCLSPHLPACRRSSVGLLRTQLTTMTATTMNATTMTATTTTVTTMTATTMTVTATATAAATATANTSAMAALTPSTATATATATANATTATTATTATATATTITMPTYQQWRHFFPCGGRVQLGRRLRGTRGRFHHDLVWGMTSNAFETPRRQLIRSHQAADASSSARPDGGKLSRHALKYLNRFVCGSARPDTACFFEMASSSPAKHVRDAPNACTAEPRCCGTEPRSTTHVTATSCTFGEQRPVTADSKCLDSQRPRTTHRGLAKMPFP